MNELELIKSQLTDINTKRVRIQTLVEQAVKQCNEIQQKYNITSLEELKQLVDKAELDRQAEMQAAKQYIEQTNQILSTYTGIL